MASELNKPEDIKLMAETLVVVACTGEWLDRLTVAGVCAAFEWAKVRCMTDSFQKYVGTILRESLVQPTARAETEKEKGAKP